MAEAFIKQYPAAEEGQNALVSDLQALWAFDRVERDGNNVKLWVNSNTYIAVSNDRAPYVRLLHKGMIVGTMGGGSTTWVRAAMYAVKTNTVTLLSVDSGDFSDGLDVDWLAQSVIVLSKSTNHYNGNISAVASMLWYSESGSVYYPYICADDTSDITINMPVSIMYTTNSARKNEKLAVLEPFIAADTGSSLNDVYMLKQTPLQHFYYGDCTINGRKFYSFGFIFVEDK